LSNEYLTTKPKYKQGGSGGGPFVAGKTPISESVEIRFAAFWRPTQTIGARKIGLPKRQKTVKSSKLLAAIVSDKAYEK